VGIYAEQINVDDDDVDDVLTLAEGRGRGQPGEKVMNVIVHHAGHGPPSAPAADATGALRVAGERLSLARNVLANIDSNVCASVVVPARADSACASLELDYAQRVADTPPSYAEAQGRVAPTAAASGYYQWTPTPLLGQQLAAPATTTTPPTAAVVDVSPVQSTPTAPPTPGSPAVSPVSTVMPTEEADRLHAALREMERFLDLPQQSSLSMELQQTVTTTTTTPITTAAAPRPFLYPPPPAAPTGRTGRHRLRATPPDSQACSSTSTLQSCSEAELDFSAFEATRRRRCAHRPAPTQPALAKAAVANSLASRTMSHRSDTSAISRRSVVVTTEVIGMVNRMTDTLLQVAHQSRDDAVARERLLLQQHQLLQRENTEREEFLVKQMIEREQFLAQQQFDREKLLILQQEKTATEALEKEKLLLQQNERAAAEALEREKVMATQASEDKKVMATQASEREKVMAAQAAEREKMMATQALEEKKLLAQQHEKAAALALEDKKVMATQALEREKAMAAQALEEKKLLIQQ